MPTCFIIGQILMLFAQREVEAKPKKLWSLPLLVTLAYGALVFVPVTAWFFYQYPGWSTVYLRPESDFPFWSGPFIFFTYLLGLFLGGLLAQLLIQLKRKKIVFLTLGLGVLWLAGIWLLTLDEYLHIGTYADYYTGTAPRIFENQTFMNSLNVMGGILIVPVVGLAIYFYRRK